ncbi:MAG: cyclic pyranopterin monophosphate synthase MoaC [Desulfurococcaceae archaeon]|nr:cyclic pyranopterin monophosphate synthase MoaC [Desulfurococcaceae archaeon]
MSVRMVDVSSKPEVFREAVAEGFIKLKKETVRLVREGLVEKGDVLTVSSVAALLAVKKTPELLPLTHNIPITHVSTSYEVLDDGVKVTVVVRTTAKTGAEMEALAGVMSALLNIWDMVKKYEKDENGQYPETVISNVRVVRKTKET